MLDLIGRNKELFTEDIEQNSMELDTIVSKSRLIGRHN
jgi:hypothetical protein